MDCPAIECNVDTHAGLASYAPGTGHALSAQPELEQSSKVPVIRQPWTPSRPACPCLESFFPGELCVAERRTPVIITNPPDFATLILGILEPPLNPFADAVEIGA
jgi:hypothetical protein